MKKILLSIKPQFVDKIRCGEKLYEYRKSIFKDKNVATILIYSSAPVKKIVAECQIESVISGSPKLIWKQTKQNGGVTEAFFNKYFQGKKVAYAIKLSNIFFYPQSISLEDIGVEYAPQSFRYVEQ